MELNTTICISNCIYDTLLWFNLYSCNIQKEVIGIMVSNDIELRMIATQITMKASVGAEDLCSRYSSVSRMLGNMFNDVYYILQDVRYRYEPTLKSKACLKCLYFTKIISDLCRNLECFSYLYTINQTE